MRFPLPPRHRTAGALRPVFLVPNLRARLPSLPASIMPACGKGLVAGWRARAPGSTCPQRQAKERAGAPAAHASLLRAAARQAELALIAPQHGGENVGIIIAPGANGGSAEAAGLGKFERRVEQLPLLGNQH